VESRPDLATFNKNMCRSQIVTLGHGQPQWEFGSFGKVYHQAAKQALARLRRRKNVEGSEACPVIFLYRHAVELYLKSIVSVGRTVFHLAGPPPPQLNGDLYNTHRLDHLLATVTTIVKPLGIRPETPVVGTFVYRDVKKIIGELSTMDERSYVFRYPIDTQGATSIPRGTTLDISRFGVLFNAVLSFLAQCNAFLESRWHQMVEAHTEAEAEGKEGQWPTIALSGWLKN
jgi:hypothetical protein